MNADLSVDVQHPERVRQAVSPSLRDSDAVTFDVAADEELHVTVAAATLGTLRGATNTALMLTKLADTVLTR